MPQKNNSEIQLEEAIHLITRLIEIKTTPSNFSEFIKTVEFVKNYFSDSNVFIREHWFNNFPALFISTKDTKKPKILFQGHLDVVNGKDEQFIPLIEGNKLFGRGSVDMKSFVALAMMLLKENTEMDLGLIITFDEEIGSENGAKKMFELGYTADLLFNGDGGYNYSVIYGEKGILKIKVKTKANPGRHPYPWKGPNAFNLFLEDYEKLKMIFQENKIATEEKNWHSTYSIYDVVVSNEEFYSPNLVDAKINVYFTEDKSTKELFEIIKKEFRNSDLEIISNSERVFVDSKSKYALNLKEIMEHHFGREIEMRTENGSSDARFYANSNIPIVIVKVVGEDYHGENEHILINELIPLYHSMEDFVYNYFQMELQDQKILYAQGA
jgi:succinyl-diaminopimelate desuccinylase